jgi:hypothetical protein
MYGEQGRCRFANKNRLQLQDRLVLAEQIGLERRVLGFPDDYVQLIDLQMKILSSLVAHTGCIRCAT